MRREGGGVEVVLRGPLPSYHSALVEPDRRRVPSGAYWAMGICAGAAWLLLVYALSWHTSPGNSDEANAVLAGQAMAHGNWFLHGWRLPPDTYWPVDLGLYAVYSVVAGVGRSAFHAVPVAIYAAVVTVGAAMAAVGAQGQRRILALGVTLTLLGLPAPVLAAEVLQGPNHVGTVLLCLTAFALVGRRPIGAWGAGALLLGAAILGDPTALAIGLTPVVVAGAVAALRSRTWRAAWRPWGAAAAAQLAAMGGRLFLSRAGQRVAPRLPFASSRLVDNAQNLPRNVAGLLGVGSISELSTAQQIVHLVGVSAVAVGVAVASFSIVRAIRRPAVRRRNRDPGGPWLDDVLVVAFWGGLSTFALAALTVKDPGALRYLAPAVIFGSVLVGRRAARLPWPRATSVLRWASAAAAVLVALYALGTVTPTTKPAPPGPQALEDWLLSRGLQVGVGAYWDASHITVSTDARITVRPVFSYHGRLRPFLYYASGDWYRPGPTAPRPSFLVYEPERPWGGVDAATARATFGAEASTTRVGVYQVMVWDRDVLAQLGSPVDETTP